MKNKKLKKICCILLVLNSFINAVSAASLLLIGEQLVKDCLVQAKKCGYGVLQFNAVVESNVHARHLYERLGVVQLGTIPNGFRMKDGHFENICPYYHEL